MSFNKEEYLKRFSTLLSLIDERNRIHEIYYFDFEKIYSREEKLIARDKLRSLSERFLELKTSLTNSSDSEEWINAWGKCPCGKGTL